MHTQIQIPRAVQDLSKVRRWICIRPGRVRFFKRHAHRRQRRYFNQLMDKFCLDPELYDNEGFRGLPRSLTSWDLD